MRHVSVILLCVWSLIAYSSVPDIEPYESIDSLLLPDLEVSATRYSSAENRMPLQVTRLTPDMLREGQLKQPKDVARFVPNLLMPDYGSAMTSSIYIRGMGSRIDQPAIGLMIDGVPLLDKNMYDHRMTDLSCVEFLRGAQGTLYGRNTIGGIMDIRTLQPLDFHTLHIRAHATYSTANSVDAAASVYSPQTDKWGWGLTADYHRTDGFFTNDYNGRLVDKGQGAGGRFVLDFRPDGHWRVGNTISFDWLRQGAFPYSSVKTGRIAFNDENSYERYVVQDRLSASYTNSGYRLQLTGSYQMLLDDMRMDQDYSPASIFTLQQKQRMFGGTADAFLEAPRPVEWYEWNIGISTFARQTTMSAPVTFKRQGIDDIILYNANKGIRSIFPNDSLEIQEPTLPITDDFVILSAGAAAYHQSTFHYRHWRFSLGLRLDYETVRMRYDAYADLHYRFTYGNPPLTHLHSALDGTKQNHYFNLLPRLAVAYDWKEATLYAYAAEGFKAGGFNPQIFSTIMQNMLMNDIGAGLGMTMNTDKRFTDVAITSYKPEKAWTAEIGTHIRPLDGLLINADAFFIYCQDQQVTVFPNGKTTGRMMANAARSRIFGAETDVMYRWQASQWQGMVQAAYGYTNARFIQFDDGMGDYKNNHIPYTPEHTLHATVQAAYNVNKKYLQRLSLSIKGDGIGKIYWNEKNSLSQPFYGLLGASLTMSWQWFDLILWAKNLTNTRYDVFYFLSMENDYTQKAKPRELGITVQMRLEK